jgi:hypothetical protein
MEILADEHGSSLRIEVETREREMYSNVKKEGIR